MTFSDKSNENKSDSMSVGFQRVIAVIVVLNIVIIGYCLSKRPQADVQKEAQPIDASGGVPIQRVRIDKFIEQVANYRDYNGLAEGLNDNVASDDPINIVMAAGGYSSDLILQTEFLCVLADRRVARLYSMLAQVSSKEAERRVVDLFKRNLSKFKAWREEYIKIMLETEGKGRYTEFPCDNPYQNSYHGLAAACFLGAKYTKASRLGEMFDEWSRCADDFSRRLEGNTKSLGCLKSGFKMYGRPQNLLMVNCFVLYLEDHGCVPDRFLKSTAEQLNSCCFHKNAYLEWDATTIPQDFTHIHRFVAIDESKKIRDIHVASEWGRLQANFDEQARIVKEFRKMAEDCR